MMREIIGGIVVAALLIAYHSLFPLVRIHYTDERTIICDMPRAEQPPSPWQRGGI